MAQKSVLCIAADGCEDVELVAIIDVLTRVGIQVTLASISSMILQCAYGSRIQADMLLTPASIANASQFDGVVVPGGKKNALALSQNEDVLQFFRQFDTEKKLVGAICAAPSHVLVAAGVVKGRNVSGDPAFNELLEAAGGVLTGKAVTTDANMVTGTGPGSALQFGLALAEYLTGNSATEAFRKKWGMPA